MASRARRRNQRDTRKPGTAVAVRPRADVVQPEVRQPPVFVSTYGEPNAEKILSSFEQYCTLAYGGNAAIFGLLNMQMRLFSEARLGWLDEEKDLTFEPGLEKLETPWPNGTTGELLARMRQDAAIAGNAYVRDCGYRLERLRPDWVTIVSFVTRDDFGHEVREVIGYWYEPDGDPERQSAWYPVDEVAHWAPIPDPMANWRGMSWFTPALREINADRAMTEHREKFWRNAATPNIIIKYSGKITPSQKIGLVESIAAKHGGPDKAGGTLVLDEGADPFIVGSKLSDAEFSEVLAATENRMAVAAGVPALLVGLKEGLNAAAWSMYRQAIKAFADLFVRPDWRSACASLSVLVVADRPAGKRLWFDTTDIAALSEGEQETASRMQVDAATVASLIQAGFTPESSVKAVKAGDITLLVHTGLVSVQLLPPGPQEETDPDPAAEPAVGGENPAEGDDATVARALATTLGDELAWARDQIERGWSKADFAVAEAKGVVKRDRNDGKFTNKVASALLSGAVDALDKFDREPLRREARKRGIELPRGASIDAIKDALWDHEQSGVDDEADLPDGEKSRLDLARLTVPELKERAKANGITGYSKMRKAELVAALGPSDGGKGSTVTFLPGRYREPVTLERGTPEGDLVAAYARESEGTTDLISISRLRHATEMRGHSMADFDAAVRRLSNDGLIVAAAEENPKALSEDAATWAVKIGGEDRHLIAIGRLRDERGNQPSTIVDNKETFRPFPGSEPQPESSPTTLEKAQARQRSIDKARPVGNAAAELLEIASNGATVEQLRQRLRTKLALVETGPDRDRTALPALARMQAEGDGATSVDEVTAIVRRIADEEGLELIGVPGEDVSFDPETHLDLVEGNQLPMGTPAFVLKPGFRHKETGALLERPSVAKSETKPDAVPATNKDTIDALTRRIKQIDEAMDEVEGRAARQLNETRKQLVEQRAALAAKPDRGDVAPAGAKPDVAAVLEQIAPMRANPKSGDRQRVAELLDPLTVKQLDDVILANGWQNAIRGTKEEKRRHLVESLVGFKLDSNAIMGRKQPDMFDQRGAELDYAERRIRKAYAQLVLKPHESPWNHVGVEGDDHEIVFISDLRKEVPDLPRQQFDAAIVRLASGGYDRNVSALASTKQMHLTQEHRSDGVSMAGETLHELEIRGNWRDALADDVDTQPNPRLTGAAAVAVPDAPKPAFRRHTRDLPDELVYDIERDMRAGHLAVIARRRDVDAEWTNIADWRGPLDAKYGRANVDRVFLDLVSAAGPDRGFFAIPQSNQKILTPEQRAAAVSFNGGSANRDAGGQDYHLLSLRKSQNPAEPKLVAVRPVPDTPTAPSARVPSLAAQRWSEVLRQLRNATADDEQMVRDLLGTLSKDDLHEIAGELETATKPKKSASKAAHIDALVFGSVGFKERAAAQGSPFAGAASTRDFTVASSSDPLSGVFGGSRRTNPAPRDTFLSNAGGDAATADLAPFKYAEKAEPIPSEWTTMAIAELTPVLANVTADDEGKVRGALQGRDKAELTKIAKVLPTVLAPSSGSTAQQFIDAIVEGTVGFRARARAMGGYFGSQQRSLEPSDEGEITRGWTKETFRKAVGLNRVKRDGEGQFAGSSVASTSSPWTLPALPAAATAPSRSPDRVAIPPVRYSGQGDRDLMAKRSPVELAGDIDSLASQHAPSGWQGGRNGPNGDEQLQAIVVKQGFDGKPRVVSRSQLDELVGKGHLELFRGAVDPDPDATPELAGMTAETFHNQFRNGTYRSGYGTFGNGTYASPVRSFAAEYSAGRESSIMRLALRPDAKVADYTQLEAEHEAFHGQFDRGTLESRLWSDIGRYAAARGYDAIIFNAEDGTQIHNVVILNRTVVTVEAAP